MRVVSLLLVLNFSIRVSASTNYDRQEADACITISERFSVKIFMSKDLDYFGDCLMNEVRDRTIHGFDLRITGKKLNEESIKLANTIIFGGDKNE